MANDNYSTPEQIKSLFRGYFDPCPLNEKPDFNGLEIGKCEKCGYLESGHIWDYADIWKSNGKIEGDKNE